MMFLINAIYFKGTWTYEFDKELTKEAPFRLPDGSEKQVDMMAIAGEFQYLSNSDFQAIDLPYGYEMFSMTILLPNRESNVDSLIAMVSEENWSKWIDGFANVQMDLYLPKFKLEYEIPLKDVLTALGMGVAFIPYEADFSGINAEMPDLHISKVKHKTFVEVNEEGTEAAAVTSVEMAIESVPERTVMRVDRPFLFVIRENRSEAVLFMGKIVEPATG